MQYRVNDLSKPPEDGIIELKRSAVGHYVMVVILGLLGAPLSLVALVAITASEPNFMAHLLGGMGMGFFGFSILLAVFWDLPKRFFFDNNKGMLFVEAKDKTGKLTSFALPYEEIDQFVTIEHTTSDSEGSSTSYCTELYKTDGASWRFTQEGSFETADNMTQYLTEFVDLEVETEEEPALPTDEFSVHEEENSTYLAWHLRQPLGRSLVLLFIVSGFGLIGRGLLLDQPGAISWVVLAFVVLVMASILYNIIASFGSRMVIEVTEDQLRAYQKGGLPIKKSFTMPLNQLDAIMFNFVPNSQGNAELQLLNAEQRDLFIRFKTGNVRPNDLMEFIKAKWNIKKLPIEALSFGGRMALEHRLQEIIQERNGQRPD